MRRQGIFSPLRWVSAFLIMAAIVLTAYQLVVYSRIRSTLSTGLVIAGVPVGGLDRQEAAQRLLEAYATPVELRYNDAVIHLNPSVVDFQLDTESMLAAGDMQRTQQVFWQGFWDFLWNRSSNPSEIPLKSSYSEARLRT